MNRLHIDIPLTADLEESKILAQLFIDIMHQGCQKSMEIYMAKDQLSVIQYRLGNDFDRGNKNYLDINENGHASNKKFQIILNQE